MKCIKSQSGKITRVNDALAQQRVTEGNWQFCGKEEWKAVTRATKVDTATTETSKDPESV